MQDERNQIHSEFPSAVKAAQSPGEACLMYRQSPQVEESVQNAGNHRNFAIQVLQGIATKLFFGVRCSICLPNSDMQDRFSGWAEGVDQGPYCTILPLVLCSAVIGHILGRVLGRYGLARETDAGTCPCNQKGLEALYWLV